MAKGGDLLVHRMILAGFRIVYLSVSLSHTHTYTHTYTPTHLLSISCHLSPSLSFSHSRKVTPPRLPRGMQKQGMLSTRTPHRFSPIGLTLARLIRVERQGQKEATLVLAEIDIVTGTPILDVKPYVLDTTSKTRLGIA